MERLIFATNNTHKVEEIQKALGSSLNVISLKEAGIIIDIPEPFDTLEENAHIKAKTIYDLTGDNCFSEDTGLEVQELGGEPGVKSARYAGDNRSFDQNIEKLLVNLAGKKNRNARFRTIICLVWNGTYSTFEGICEGKILESRLGKAGFGYDSVFIPNGANKSFAEMEMEEKNRFSHRRKAADKLILFLQNQVD